MLSEVRLPKTFWGYSTLHAAHIINRVPTRALKDVIISFEAFTGNKPSVSHLGIFGCKMFVHILLRLYSNDIGSKGLWSQLIRCAPFPSIAQYFRKLYILCLKILMAIVAYLKVWTTIVWYPKVRISIIYLSKSKD
jgi:hypothetical protein